MQSRILAAFLAAAFFSAPLAANAQASPASLSGRVLDASGGLPVQNATVELDAAGKKVATTTTDAYGTFGFPNEPQGEYSVLIIARGYLSSRIPTVLLTNGNATSITTAMQATNNSSSNLKEIGRVVIAPRSSQSLQTTTTVNEYVDPSMVQNFAYAHVGDLLARLPGVDMHTSPSVGDDMSISIRGFDPSETATLLDGHPIGPIGFSSGGFNYKLAPFWGLSGTSVIFGSGASGMYGVSSIAGAVNFETLNPTRDLQGAFTQGVGNDGHLLSGFHTTGTAGKFGYALAGATQGTYGTFAPQSITQRGLLSASAVCNTPGGPTCLSNNGGVPGSGFAAPDMSTQNINSPYNTYTVSANYLQRNGLAKVIYSPSAKTQVELAAFDATTWNDKSGNGDQDYYDYPFVLFNANNIIKGYAPGTNGSNFFLNGALTNCTGATIAAVDNSKQGYSCLTAQQYAKDFYGPAGGGNPYRLNGSWMQDYHGRVTQQLGQTQLVIDSFVNNLSSDEIKADVGPYFFDTYLTHGLLVSDEFQARKHDISFGYYTQHQRHASETNFSDPTKSSANGTFYLTSNSYFVRDSWQNSLKFSTFADLWYQHSGDTGVNNFDPRLTFAYRPDSNDVIRLSGGRSYSEPDPSLVLATVPQTGAPSSLNSAFPFITSIGSIGSPGLKPETATDEEIAYGHRFARNIKVELDAYNTLENNAILSGVLPISSYPQYASILNAPTTYNGQQMTLQQAYINRISAACSCQVTANDLGWSTTANAAQAVYRGINLDATIGLVRNLTFEGQYGIQSAMYRGVPIGILQNNPYTNNNTQFNHIPLHKALTSLVYQNAAGVRAEMDGTYTGNNNEYDRPAFWYADASISKTTGPVTVAFGVTNLFNSAYQQYGLIGQGYFMPQNQFGTAQSSFDEGSGAELYGLPSRQGWLTVTFHM